MKEFKVGDEVKCHIKVYDHLTEDYPEENNIVITGTIVEDFEDGSFLVDNKENTILVELYNDETIELLMVELTTEDFLYKGKE